MKQAIINILNALADRIRPCRHSWEKWDSVRVDGWYTVHHFCCEKCGRFKRVKSS